MHRIVTKKTLSLLAVTLMMAACSTHDKNGDPLETMNRGVFAFNQTVDAYIMRPVAWSYRYVTPQTVRTHIGNVSSNLSEPLNMVNAFLQGDFDQGMTSFWRFTLNSTIGLGGINDVAATAGLKQRDEDFGQTLAVWGVGDGPYLMLPIFGPSTLRDTGGMVADWYMDPLTYAIDDTSTSIWIAGGKGLVKREELLDPIDDINASSLDPYASFRSIYQQRRAAEIRNHHSEKPKL